MKAIIFGINGQDGYYLAEICRKAHIEVIGVARSAGDWIQGNVADFDFVDQLINTVKPDFVFHLAAVSTTRHSSLFENHEAISTGTINILEAVKNHKSDCRVFLTGSGVQFVNRMMPISENDPFEASSAYAVARIHSAFAARYFRTLGLKVYFGYLFHHESPLRKSNHLSKYIADGVNRIAGGSKMKLVIGDTSVSKEWAFAGDIASGIFHLVNQDEVFEATIGTGIAYRIQDWVEACFSAVGLHWADHVEHPPQPFNAEYKMLVSNNNTICSLGWSPRVSFEQLVGIMMNPGKIV